MEFAEAICACTCWSTGSALMSNEGGGVVPEPPAEPEPGALLLVDALGGLGLDGIEGPEPPSSALLMPGSVPLLAAVLNPPAGCRRFGEEPAA